ncbi:hypothetical protein WUBG_09738 [Wuchereria bancrofti]|uniref:Ig-like domain-containing protein n=1 Tax=Wuchereria bancrofti TaxID=6293 RepID=J9EQK7_WUCBA|nr:hypothetical protein WUBG_09738 [Wuchereria bancrofti]
MKILFSVKTEYDTRTGICALIIPQMFADDIGEYTCRANNAHGVAESSAKLMPRDEFEKWFYEQQSLITTERKQAMLAQSQKQKPETNFPITRTTFQQRQSVIQQRPATIAERQTKFVQNGTFDCDSTTEIPWGLSESETEAELASIDSRGFGGPPRIQTPLKDLRLTEGTDALLQCNITGNPKPKITWLKNGKIVDVINSKGMMTLFKGSLVLMKISSVVPKDSGEYTLTAENYYGKVKCFLKLKICI